MRRVQVIFRTQRHAPVATGAGIATNTVLSMTIPTGNRAMFPTIRHSSLWLRLCKTRQTLNVAIDNQLPSVAVSPRQSC